MTSKGFVIALLLSAGIGVGLDGAGVCAVASPLDDKVAKFEDASATQTEAQVAAILKAGIDEARSAEALAVVQAWLNRNHLSDQSSLYYAGQAAERSGQPLAAVGYYQRLLQSNKPDPKLAGPAVDGLYRLLLGTLSDPGAAYLYMHKDGNRVRAFGQAKRYDRWFLNQAKSKRDLVAVADRLAVIAADKSTKTDRFNGDFDWLCTELEQFRKEEAGVYDAALRLAKVPGTPAVAQARLNWAGTVIPYNLKLDELRKANAPADPKLTDAPLAAAAALIKAEPDHGPFAVANGWGTEYDGHHGTCALRFQVEGDRKLAQLLAALPRMSPQLRDDLLAYPIARGRIKFDVMDIWEAVLKHPESFNSLDASRVAMFDKEKLSVEQAKKLAPHLARNPHPEAAMIRAIAQSASLESSKITGALVKTEAWRFATMKDAVDTAWHASTVQDAQHKALLQQYGKTDPRYDQLAKKVAKGVTGKPRIDAFNALYKDLLSAEPTTPGALSLWDELFTHAPDADDVQMVKAMAGDTSGPRGLLLRRAIGKIGIGNKNSGKLQWEGQVYDNQFRYHRKPVQDAVPGLITHLQQMVEKQAQAGTIDPLVFGMWLHTVDPGKGDAKSVIKKVVASPAYNKLDESYHKSVADGNHFGMAFATPAIEQARPSYASRELLALHEDAKEQAVEAALSAVIKRVESMDEPVTVVGLEPVAKLAKWSDQTRRHVLSLFLENAPIGHYPNRQGYEPLIVRLADEAREQKKWGDLEPYLAGIWRAADARDHHNHEAVPRLVGLTEAMLDAGQQSLAISAARSGLASRVGRSLSASTDERNKLLVGRLSQVQGKASIALGIIDIPVDERDPAYPVYKSQAEFAVGNTAAAWELYDEHADRLMSVIRDLTVPYCLWVLEREIEAEQGERAEALIRELTVWSREAAGTFTAEQEAELKIAYADAAFQDGNLQTAKAWYRRVADAQEYQNTPLQYKAILRCVAVDRASKDFDSAMAELDKLMLVRDEELRVKVHYARAEVLFDQEAYAESFAEVSTVLKRDPSHPDALILLGKAQLEMRKLVDASEIELGVTRDQKMIVPGEILKINLSDPALNISGVGADIEVEVWTKSGDRERVMLYQLGDDKTKFRAEVPVRLGPRVPGDKTLQVLGRDEIRYGYSKRFREKMTDLPADPDVVITVASDARLVATAGAFPAREGERKLDLEELGVSTAQQALGTRQVRPGNPVYIRVTDPDQSKTDQIDKLVVSLETSSGDVIPRLVLEETGPHTGEFEAAVPTGPAQALAFASESAPGRDANMVISKNDYPGWSGEVGSKQQDQFFTIDLNDNVPLDKLTLKCDDPATALTHFVVQTSLNGNDWETRARFPKDPAAWDGRPQVTAFPTYNRNSLAITKPKDRTAPEDWRYKMEIASARPDINYNAFTVANLGAFDPELPSGGHPGYSVLVRYRAVFYQGAAAIRTFKLAGLPNADKTQTIFLIDGKPADEDSDAMTITRELRPGPHTIEVWRHESRNELLKRKPQLLSNTGESDELRPCPDAMFDPATFPAPARESIAAATTVTASGDAPGVFNIAFGQRTRARLIRLAIVGHEGPAPSLHKATLTDRDAKQRLPVDTDYQQLRANEKLEVVPGDRVSVRFEDDRVVTDRRAIQQAGLSVAYNTATISASFLTYEMNKEGERVLVLEPIRRFKMDDAVGIVINDADMDQTPEPDTVQFTVKSSGGAVATIKALETGPHTGEFLGRVFPLSSQPQRDSEIAVPEGGTLVATYRDAENLDPGIPTDRTVMVEHAAYTEPELVAYDTTSRALPTRERGADGGKDDDERGPEIVLPQRAVDYTYLVDDASGRGGPTAILGASVRFDVLATHLAFAQSSEIAAYVQTESGRRAYKPAGGGATLPFDVRVPGTLKLTAAPARSNAAAVPPGYTLGAAAQPPTSRPAVDEGRFAFTVPLVLDDVPLRSFATKDAEALHRSLVPEALAVRPGDVIHVGFAYLDKSGAAKWKTLSFKTTSHSFLDVMNSRYRKDITTAYVGEKLYVRLISPGLDKSPGRDMVRVNLKAESGATVAYELMESEVHSGVFKGSFGLSYADQPIAADAELPPVALHGLPVKYGDKVSVSYSDAPAPITVDVNKGADGGIEPFSKRYGEDAVAIQTTFTLAECYFELAKHHRKMEEESLARREMGHAQKLLAEAIESHRDDEMQAHAEYLLGNLAQEYADLSKNESAKREMYQDALARFSKIPLDYPDTEFAPKAQFKKGLVYERLGEVDIAVEEYVKLAYKYPDHELIPSVMSRLGSYFQAQGLALKQEAESLETQEDNPEAQGEAIALREKMVKEYLNAAQVFKKLEERFPTDPLAGLAGLRSAQNYLRAGYYDEAIVGFEKVYDNEEYDDKTVRSQAMFWAGISYERKIELQQAYQLYRRVTFDFPDSVWAKQSRGRLADPAFARIIEIETLQRERMLEGLKNEQKKRR